jgi:hypothetical protein
MLRPRVLFALEAVCYDHCLIFVPQSHRGHIAPKAILDTGASIGDSAMLLAR